MNRYGAAFMFAAMLGGLAGAGALGTGPAAADLGPVERGRYLVVQAGVCANCHGSGLHGATLDFLAPGLPVARKAPGIAGLPQLTQAQAVAFFETGLLPRRVRARPPMPQYRFERPDAVAIVAYLKTLR